MRVHTGLEVFLRRGAGRRCGLKTALLTNSSATDNLLQTTLDLIEAKFSLSCVFAPEHGLEAALPAGSGGSGQGVCAAPVIRFYPVSPMDTPRSDLLAGIDLLLIDLPDIGTRCYTYAGTMIAAMKAAAAAGTKVVILDRPNPITGIHCEGAPLAAQCRSLCGYLCTPNRHALTLGEIAVLANEGWNCNANDQLPRIGCNLEIAACTNWQRSMFFEQTGLPWVPPSPGIPRPETALLYCGTSLFEGTNVSEGRGTALPFQIIGAPYIDGRRWAAKAAETKLNGALLRPLTFMPQYSKWAGQLCGGVQIHITDRMSFAPVRWAVVLLHALRELYPEQFLPGIEPAEAGQSFALDRLFGSERLRSFLTGAEKPAVLLDEFAGFEDTYRRQRNELLIYR